MRPVVDGAGWREREKVLARDWAREGIYSWVERARLVGGVVGLGSLRSRTVSPVRCGTRSPLVFRGRTLARSRSCMCALALARDICRFRVAEHRAPDRKATVSEGRSLPLSHSVSSLTRVYARARAHVYVCVLSEQVCVRVPMRTCTPDARCIRGRRRRHAVMNADDKRGSDPTCSSGGARHRAARIPRDEHACGSLLAAPGRAERRRAAPR